MYNLCKRERGAGNICRGTYVGAQLTSHSLALGVVDLQGQGPVFKLSNQVDESVVYPLDFLWGKYICMYVYVSDEMEGCV